MPETKSQRVGKILRRKRLAKKMTQTQLSEALGYSNAQFISNWERGISCPPLTIMPQLCAILKIPKAEVIEIFMSEYRRELEEAFKTATKKSR